MIVAVFAVMMGAPCIDIVLGDRAEAQQHGPVAQAGPYTRETRG